jgi:hypothetical protein
MNVKSHFGLEREGMYASRTGGSDGYGAPVVNELVKKHFGQKYSLTSKGSVIEVSDPSGAVAFTSLQLSYVNIDDYDLQITRQYGFALITHHYVSLLCNTIIAT